jgi:IS4 transposase
VASSIHVYDSENKLLSFDKIYREMQKTGASQKELRVFIGKKQRMEVRLILRLVPDETRRRYRFNLFITNAGEDILPLENVFPLYQLRRQIEWMFKVWKSVFGINRLQRMKEERYIALLYIRLLLIVINLQMTYRIQVVLPVGKQGKRSVLSLNRALKTMSSLFNRLMEILRTSRKRAMTIETSSML